MVYTIKIILLTTVCFILSVFSIKPQSNLWTEILENQIVKTGEQYIIPNSYRTVKLNLIEAKSLLSLAPMEFSSEVYKDGSVIELPMPDGTFQRFNFWESPTMEPELQNQYPEIRTYSGQGIDDLYATLKFDLTPHGFHAQILSPSGRVFIDPHNKGDVQHYISYYTEDFIKKDATLDCHLFIEDGKLVELNSLKENSFLTPTGSQLRTYRLCVAATGEYTNFHGGTVSLGLAAVVTSVNRVNGVYEKEVAVRMVLIANNNLVIYTNASTDPYSNTNGSAMLGQNISNLSTVIGNANFDIGHVFSTGGGGVAYLGVVCTSNKAGGVTGSGSPIGDPFDIDYVAHEMGHQFSGNHSFNGTSGSCSGGNRNASTAYEPGSGSTIMAYAGICSPQDLQSNSDAYFHSVNFDEIIAFTNSGTGNGCAVTTNTGNNAPVVTVPAGGFAIPKSTPFSLTGSATDPNSDAMTYCWEEYDLGPAGAPGTPSGDAPIFRSWNPTTSPTRTFPRLSDLLNNTTVLGELLPSYDRNLKFRLTVRDNKAGGGGVDRAQVNFTVDGNSGPFIVTSPNTNVSWTGNISQTITWSVANTTASPVNCANVRILLSTNGGNTFSTELIASTPNDGSEVITLPNLPTTQARIKVEAVGNIFFDISNTNFTIVNNPGTADPASFTATPTSSSQISLSFTPNTGNNNVVIVWNNTGTFSTPSGAPPTVGGTLAGGTVIYNGTSSPQLHSGLSAGASYFYKAFSYDGSTYSSGLNSNATTFSIQDPGIFNLIPISSTEIYIFFTPNIVSNNVVIVWNNSGTFSTPAGPPPVTGQPFAGGTLLYNGITSPQIHSGLTSATYYYYKAFSFDGTNFSAGVSADTTTLPATSTFQFSISIFNEWNMVSVPGLNPAGQGVSTWWSNRNTQADVFKWNGSYSVVTNTTPGEGYWMLHTGAQTYNYPAIQIVNHDPIPLTTGWNMIGGYENTPSVAGLTTTPPGLIVAGTVYGWTGSYTNATNLVPGYGYWLLSTGNGSINPPTMAAGSSKIAEQDKSEWGKITLTDAAGKSYTLYAVNGDSPNGAAGVNLNQYSMPPLPPAGTFDVRFGSNRKAEDLSESNQTIEMRGLEYPVTVRVEKMGIKLEDETGKLISERLKSGEELVISNSQVRKLMVTSEVMPEVYSLEQNYPNPFNPSTIIKFSVPKQTHLKLNLYSVLGEFIQTITEGMYEAGFYKITFEANNLVSGVYIYRMESSEIVQSRKLVLIR